MATLRNGWISGAARPQITQQDLDSLEASGMGSLQKGWQSGRIGTDANALSADELSLRANGDIAGADALRAEIAALQQRQQTFAPGIGQVEQIKSLRDAGSWAAGQVGQGAASMVEPIAAATTLTGAGRIVGAIPHPLARGVGMGLQGAGMAVPFAINQRQMTGEFGNEANQDPELMARTTPAQLRDTANLVGIGGGALDTVLPGMIGRQFAGAGLRKGISPMGPGARTGLGMLGEGTTELGQGKISQYARGELNPNRDTSGDFSDDINNFAGGAVGSGPLVAAGAYADAGFRRTGDTAARINEAAGSVVDLAGETVDKFRDRPDVQAAEEKVGKWWQFGKEKVVDLADRAPGMADKAKGAVKDAVAARRSDDEDLAVLSAEMPPEVAANPDDKAILDWFAQNDTAQRGVVTERLKAMNTPEATQLLQAMETGGTPEAVKAAQDAAVGYVRQKIGERSLSDVMAKHAGAVAAWGGKMAVKAGKGAYAAAQTAAASAKQEYGKKRNAQVDKAAPDQRGGFSTTGDAQGIDKSGDPYQQWQERTNFGQRNDAADAAVEGLSKPSPEQEQSFRRATLYATKLTSLGKRTLGLKSSPHTIAFLRDLGYEINDVAEGVALSASVGPGNRASAAPTPGLVRLHRIAKDLKGALGTQVGPALDYLEGLADPKAKQVFGDLRDLVKSSSTEGGQLAEQAAREQAADAILALLPRDKFTSIADDENGKMELLDRLVDMQRGHAEPGLRAAIEGALGRDTLNKMMEVVSGIKAPPESAAVLDEPADAMDVKRGEKKFAKAGRSSLYGFTSPLGTRSGKTGDVFGETSGTAGLSKDERAERELVGEPGMRRPGLFHPSTDKLPSGDSKLAIAIEKLKKEVGYVDEENTGGFEVEAVTARSIMEDQKMQPGKVLQLYRDYLRQDATSKAPLDTDPVKAAAQQKERKDAAEKASLVAGLLSRSVEQSKTGKADPDAMKTDTDLSAMMMAEARAYFDERQVVVAKSLTDTDPTRMTRADAMELIEAGKKRVDEARKPGADPETLSRQNVLMFPTGGMKLNKKTGKEEMQYVPVQGSKLVKWVRDQGEQDEPKNYGEESNDRRYFADLTAGMVAFIGDGHAAGLPYKVNPNGEQEFFRAGATGTKERTGSDGREFFRDGEDGVPPSLMLPSGEYYQTLGPKHANVMGWKPEFGPKGVRALEDDEANDRVGADQARSEDPFTVEDRETRDLTEVAAKVRPRRSGKDDKRDAAKSEDDAPVLVTRGADRGASVRQRVDVSGTIAVEPKTSSDLSPFRDEADRGWGPVEADFSKGQDPRAEPDEITAQNYLTTHINEKYVAPKSGLAAMSSRRHIADGVKGTMMADEREGDRLAITMLRSALKPGYKKDERGQKFDAYRVAPLVELISTEGVQAFKRAGATDPLIDILTRGILQVLQNPDSNIAESHRVALAKLIPGIKADTTSFNLQARARALLDQMGGSVTAEEMTVNWGDPSKMAVQPKMAKQALSEAPKSTIRERVEAKKAEKAGGFDGELSADEIEGISSPVVEKAPKTPEVNFKPDEEGIRRARNRRVVEYPVTEAEQEVARKARNAKAAGGASAPLGKPPGVAPAGVKRNAMAARIHTDLGRDGFPATHDSPIRHEGKFDWRAHQGKGEGNASFGAGTYLSTADGVHRSYKNQFTAQVRKEGIESRVVIDGREFVVSSDEDGNPDFSGLGLNRAQEDVITYMVIDGLSQSEAVQSVRYDESTLARKLMENALESKPPPEIARLINMMLPIPASTPAHAGMRYDIWNRNLESAVKRLADAKALEKSVISVTALTEDKSPTYEVSVNIEPEALLDWNKPLDKQPKAAQAALKELGQDVTSDINIPATLQKFMRGRKEVSVEFEGKKYNIEVGIDGSFGMDDGTYMTPGWRTKEVVRGAMAGAVVRRSATGEEIYKALQKQLGSQAKASDYLQSLGILGHKYAASGGKNDTHPNYVIYDDSKITTNYVHFNRQDARKANGDQTLATGADMAAARLWLDKVAPGMVVNFIKESGYSGEFIEAANTINISTTAAAGILGTAYHEAMHKFWSQFVKSNPKLQATFERYVNSPKVMTRLNQLLEGYPAAQAQLVDGEERLAYAFQFWKAGLLQVDAPTTTIFQKIGAMFRRILGAVRDSEHALALFKAFDEGKLSEPSAAGRVIAAQLSKGTGTLAVRRRLDKLSQGLAAAVMPAEEIMANSVSREARRLGRTFFSNPGREGDGQGTPGYLNARTAQARKFINRSNQLFENMDILDQHAVQELMQKETAPDQISVKVHRDAVEALRGLFDEFHTYLRQSGMDIGKVDNYYPTVWSVDALIKNKDKFIKMLVAKHAEDMGAPDPHRAATRIYESLINRDGVDSHLEAAREDGVLAPFFASQNGRTLPWLGGADKAEYLEKNMVQTITRYFHQGARSAEYHRRFGKNGVFLERSLKKIRVELEKEAVKAEFKTPEDRQKWVGRQMRDITMSVGAMEGTLGKDISPNMRKFSSWMMVYQNVRLLPMSLFSSFVDPLALVARGAPLQAAYETFVRGIREVFNTWGDAFRDMPKERMKDEWTALAEHIGATEVSMFAHHVSEQYSSVYMSPGAKKVNEAMFRFNGMEAWNKSTRVMATKWAVRFLEKHAALPDKIHSARWLKELGLTPDTIPLNADGNLITDKHELSAAKGIPLPQAAAQMDVIHAALNRWVEGAVLTPNAAQRPAWASDPNYSVIFHLKQFAYSFHQTILKRAVNEFEHGNLAPVGALALFIPTMIVSDVMKGLIQGGGSLPPYMRGYTLGDHFLQAVDRSGLAGIGVIGVDATQDIWSLGGPAVEQVTDALVDSSDRTMMKAVPLNSLFRYMGGAATSTPVGT